MGLFDRLRRKDDSAAFQDPSTVDPMEALAKAREGLGDTDTYIDEHGRRRKLPDGAKDPMQKALDDMEKGINGK